MGHEEGEVFLAERERGECLGGGRTAEDKLDEWGNGDESEEVEKDCQHVEEQVGGDVPRVELGVVEDSPDVVHGGVCIGLLALQCDGEG